MKSAISKSSLRVLICTSKPFPEGGADTRRIDTVAREMVAQGVAVSLLLAFAREPQPMASLIDGIAVRWCYVPRSARQIFDGRGYVCMRVQMWGRFLALWQVLRLSLRQDYDWLYLYQPAADGLLAALAARLCGRKVCTEFTDRLSDEGLPRSLRWRLAYGLWRLGDWLTPRLSSLVIVISNELRKHYQLWARNAQMFLLPTVVDTRLFQGGDPQRYRNALGWGKEAKIVVFTGSFTRAQGVAKLVEAMAQVVRTHPLARLVIAGGSMATNRDDVDALIEKFGLCEQARNLGRIKQQDVVDLLAAADVCAVPKLDDPANHAGLSTKLAEYLASGKPVVVSRVGDVANYLSHMENAVFCRPGSVDDLAAAIMLLLSQPDRSRRIGAAGRCLAEQEFDVGANVRRLLDTISTITA